MGGPLPVGFDEVAPVSFVPHPRCANRATWSVEHCAGDRSARRDNAILPMHDVVAEIGFVVICAAHADSGRRNQLVNPPAGDEAAVGVLRRGPTDVARLGEGVGGGERASSRDGTPPGPPL